VGIVAIVLLACAVLVVVAAEWPRLSARVGADAIEKRSRARRKQRLKVVPAALEEEENDDFQASVERDLANLPVLEERDRS
jgi:hypothetical protein